MEKQQIIDFLKTLCPVWTWKVEFNDLSTAVRFEDILEMKTDIYFLAGVEDQFKRNSDDDIVFKNYFVVDFDIRENYKKKYWIILDDDVLMLYGDILKEKLKKWWYGDWRYLVFSWNWFHFYYVWHWDKYDKDKYSKVVLYHYKKIDKIFEDDVIKVDRVCKNIWRILRLPWSNNYKRAKKYKLEPCECYIVEEQEVKTNKFDEFEQILVSELESDIIDVANIQIKTYMSNVDDPVIDEILRIDIFDLIFEYNWIEKQKDNKNLKSPTDWSNIGAFVFNNVLYLTGTHHFQDNYKWYNPFTFIKIHHNLDNKWTFEWFKDKYPRLRDYKQEKEVLELKNTIDIDFWHKLPFTRWLPKTDASFGKYDLNLFNIIVWESWSGKTEYTFFQSRQNAKNVPVLYMSLEMTPQKMVERYAMKRAGITKIERSEKTMEDRQVEYMKQVMNEIIELENLTIVGMDKPSIWDIKKLINEYYVRWYNLFYIDNLWFIVWDGEEIHQTRDVSRELKTITNKLPITINLIHHFNKWWTKDREWPRWLASIRSSGKLENDADNVLQVWRDLSTDDMITDEDRAEVNLLLQKDRTFWTPSVSQVYFYKWEYVQQNPFIN